MKETKISSILPLLYSQPIFYPPNFKVPNSYELFVSIWYILIRNAEIFFHL